MTVNLRGALGWTAVTLNVCGALGSTAVTVNLRGALGSTAVTVDVRGALDFFAASCCWRSAKSSSPAANDSPSKAARTTRVIILSSSSLDFWDEEPNQPAGVTVGAGDGAQAPSPDLTPHDVDSHWVLENALLRLTSSSTHQPRSWSKA